MDYYHAGVEYGTTRVWSPHTRRSRIAAVREACRMAKKGGGVPLIEWWDRSHGLRPGSADAVRGAAYVADIYR